MASSVFYKFKSQREESRITFDGTGISVFDLKKEIILANGLAKANDFDLVVLDPSSGDEIKEDTVVIPRSSSVVVKRVPAARPGRGKASYYTAGVLGGNNPDGKPGWKGSMSKRFDGKEEPPKPAPASQAMQAVTSAAADSDEAAALAAMFQMQSANWEETQEKMSQAQRIYTNPRPGFKGGNKFPQNDRPLPASYVCYRCGKKGHWIQDCPTNSDREFDNKPRIKRTTGIPRSFLKTVENPDAGPGRAGVMVTPEGGYVVAQPDVASWAKRATRPKVLTEAEVRDRPPPPATGLACPLDGKLFAQAVKTPCCSSTYCEDCIQNHLLEKDFICPQCGTRIQSLDKLSPDGVIRARVHEYVERTIEESRVAAEEGAQAGAPGQQAQPGQTSGQVPQDGFGDPETIRQMLAQSISDLQAQIRQLQQSLNRTDLAPDVRQRSQASYRQMQMQLQQAQEMEQAFSMGIVPSEMMGMGGGFNPAMGMPQMAMGPPMPGVMPGMGGVGGFQNQQQPSGDSAYQRLPVNNRRRGPLKRDRPSDFLDVTAQDGENKVARYWE
ncbi:unnamed protein product [Peniophora sp. CBMAI 1063]|nr:unnamed protein product [Peniophora sp. CBMAI 1063]